MVFDFLNYKLGCCFILNVRLFLTYISYILYFFLIFFFWFFFLIFLNIFLWFCFRCPGHSVWARYFYISRVLVSGRDLWLCLFDFWNFFDFELCQLWLALPTLAFQPSHMEDGTVRDDTSFSFAINKSFHIPTFIFSKHSTYIFPA